ncbi:MAG TPA: transketolase C-terminal domain-containing protein [Candidatus Obscuribacterales bacterium]
MTELRFVPASEFEKVLAAKIDPIKKAEIFSTLCRINVLYMIARAGSGHIGTSFSSIDIVSWLFLNELNLPGDGVAEKDADVYFSSKGHDVPAKYSVLIAKGLLSFDKIHTLRRLGGLPGHPDISIPFMHSNTGSLGMGISKARGMALTRRLRKQKGRFFVLTGDGELQEGQFWESLQPTSNRGMSEITVIIDHNKVQSDCLVSKTSDLGDLEAKLKAFGWHVSRIDGHDFKQLQQTFEALESVKDRPKIVIADTIKGKGVSFMEHVVMGENDLYRFHSGAPSAADYERGLSELTERATMLAKALGLGAIKLESAPPAEPKNFDGYERLVGAYSRALVKEAESTPELVALDADLVLDTGLIPFKEKFPERFFECGIAEQDMVSQAGGMALEGALPVVHSFACFLSDRPNEQIFNNATELTKIIYVGSLAGLLPSGPGHSHQCVRDISALGGVPHMALVEPSCEKEVEMITRYLVKTHRESSYLRLVSIPVKIPFTLPEDYRVEFGKGVVLCDGADAAIISYGPIMLSEAYKAAQDLKQRGIALRVINLPWLNHVDTDWLFESVKDCPIVITLDNHFIRGGQGEMVLSEIARLHMPKLRKALKLGITEIPKCGQNDEVLKAHGLDSRSLAQSVTRVYEEITLIAAQ